MFCLNLQEVLQSISAVERWLLDKNPTRVTNNVPMVLWWWQHGSSSCLQESSWLLSSNTCMRGSDCTFWCKHWAFYWPFPASSSRLNSLQVESFVTFEIVVLSCYLFFFVVVSFFCTHVRANNFIELRAFHFNGVHQIFGLITLLIMITAPYLGFLADMCFVPNRPATPFFPDKVHWYTRFHPLEISFYINWWRWWLLSNYIPKHKRPLLCVDVCVCVCYIYSCFCQIRMYIGSAVTVQHFSQLWPFIWDYGDLVLQYTFGFCLLFGTLSNLDSIFSAHIWKQSTSSESTSKLSPSHNLATLQWKTLKDE